MRNASKSQLKKLLGFPQAAEKSSVFPHAAPLRFAPILRAAHSTLLDEWKHIQLIENKQRRHAPLDTIRNIATQQKTAKIAPENPTRNLPPAPHDFPIYPVTCSRIVVPLKTMERMFSRNVLRRFAFTPGSASGRIFRLSLTTRPN